MAARTRSRLSCTAASGRPTMVKAGAAATTSASTSTAWPSRPLRVSLGMRASTRLPQPSAVKAAAR